MAGWEASSFSTINATELMIVEFCGVRLTMKRAGICRWCLLVAKFYLLKRNILTDWAQIVQSTTTSVPENCRRLQRNAQSHRATYNGDFRHHELQREGPQYGCSCQLATLHQL